MMFCKIVEKEFKLEIVKEFKFHPTRKWRFDYAIPSLMIALEVEGGAYTQGRHTRGRGFIGDMEKYSEASILGWCLIRITPDDLYTSKTIQMLERAIKSRNKLAIH